LNNELYTIERSIEKIKDVGKVEIEDLMFKIEAVSYMVVKNAKEDIFN